MFDFTHLSETVTDSKDISLIQQGKKENAPIAALAAATAALGLSDVKKKEKKRKFVEITRDTPLSALSRFFEWNSAAVVTEHQPDGGLKPIAVVTKVDLLSWMVRMKKHSNGDGLRAH
jgi:cystathionine beta-synthase